MLVNPCVVYSPPDEVVDLRAIALKAKRSIKRYIERERYGRHSRETNPPQHVPRLGLCLLGLYYKAREKFKGT